MRRCSCRTVAAGDALVCAIVIVIAARVGNGKGGKGGGTCARACALLRLDWENISNVVDDDLACLLGVLRRDARSLVSSAARKIKCTGFRKWSST